MMADNTRRLRYRKGALAENPIGLHVVMPDGSLREVYGCEYREFPTPGFMLKVRSFNRELTGEINAGAAAILDRAWEAPA